MVCRRIASLATLLLCFLCLFAAKANAHPVPRRIHDRIIQVRLTPEAVVVDYRLELDEWTVIFVDLPAVSDRVDLTELHKPRDFYQAFTRSYGPILADNLVATLDGRPLTFTCVRHQHQVIDHLRCEFVFRAEWKLQPGQSHAVSFREGNYELETGRINLSLAAEAPVKLLTQSAPDEALKAKPVLDLAPGDDDRLRKVAATFAVASEKVVPARSASEGEPAPSAERSDSLLNLLLDTRRGFWLLLLLAAGFGALHALTPGHGKTLVAAYLVGEQGTVWHACVLGLVTTWTHTGAVLILAAVLPLLFPEAAPAQAQTVLGVAGGLLIAGLGFWLLLRRLAGQADHIHLGGHGHHHHHPAEQTGFGGRASSTPREKVGWWRLIALGVSGGIVPCWDAIIMLGLAIAAQKLWLGFPLLLAFSAGLAGVLVAIGIAVVSAKNFAAARWGESPRVRRLFRTLPLISAVLVTGLGLMLCYESLHP